MTFMSTLTSTSAAVLLLATASAAQSSPQRHLLIQCDGQAPDQICAVLSSEIAHEFPKMSFLVTDATVSDPALTLRYAEVSRGESWLSGQLHWLSATGQSGSSPIIEQSVMDRKLAAEDLTLFARQLIRSANLPQNIND